MKRVLRFWSVSSMNNRNVLLAQSWDAAAALYTQELAPRFLPWIQDGLSRVASHCQAMQLPSGSATILVPCCGPGLEIPLLGQVTGYAYPVLGVDLSPGMVATANGLASKHMQQVQEQRSSIPKDPWAQGGSCRQQPCSMSAVVGDALDLHSEYEGKSVVVFSSFGLQQLGPKAPEALTSWVRCLCPGGLAVVLIWPSGCEQQGPWHAYEQAVRKQQQQKQGDMQQEQQQQPQQEQGAAPALSEWEMQLTGAAQEVAGVALVEDLLIRHEMRWPDVDTFWTVMTQGGPWHARRLAFGDVHMEQLYAIFLEQLAGQQTQGVGAPEPEPEPERVGSIVGPRRGGVDEGAAGTSGRGSANEAPGPASGTAVFRSGVKRPLVHSPAARLLVFCREGRAGTQGPGAHMRVRL